MFGAGLEVYARWQPVLNDYSYHWTPFLPRRGPSRSLECSAAAAGRQAQIAEARAFAGNVLPILESIRATDVTDVRGIAQVLNSRGVGTARGGRWHVSGH